MFLKSFFANYFAFLSLLLFLYVNSATNCSQLDGISIEKLHFSTKLCKNFKFFIVTANKLAGAQNKIVKCKNT